MVWKNFQLSQLKFSGCIAYTWILTMKITKLDPKSKANDYRVQQCYKVYRLIDIDTDRVSFNIELVFDDEVGPFQTYYLEAVRG